MRHGGCPPSPPPETRPIQFLGRQLGTRFLCRLRIRLDKKLSPSSSLSSSVSPSRIERTRGKGNEGWILSRVRSLVKKNCTADARRQVRDRKTFFPFHGPPDIIDRDSNARSKCVGKDRSSRDWMHEGRD